jgi:HEAT repeat protein
MKRSRWLAVPVLTATLWRPAPAAAWDFDWAGKVESDTADLLRSDDVAQRVTGVRLLGSFDLSLTEDKLIAALADSQVSVRTEAARVLGQRGSQRAATTLIGWLADGDAKVRAIAAEALGGIGGRTATDALIRSLGDTDGVVRLRAVVGLGAIGRRGDATVAMSLVARLEDDKSDVKRAAIEQLVALRERRAVIPLAARLGDPSPDVKKDAAHALALLGDHSAAPPLLRMLEDTSEDVRSAAIEALGELAIDEAVNPLVEKLAMGTDSTRAKVVTALAKIAKTTSNETARSRAVRALLEALDRGDRFAPTAILTAGPAAVPYLLRSLDGKMPGSPRQVVDALRSIGDQRATPALLAELDRGRVPTALTLAALAATKSPAVVLPILTRTTNTDPVIRLAAMQALDGLIDEDLRVAEAIAERLTDPDAAIRLLAVRYLGRLHANSAVPALIALLGSGNPYALRIAAIDALGQIAAPAAVDALFGELHSELFDVRHAASRALAAIAAPNILTPAISLLAHRANQRPELLIALLGTLRSLPTPQPKVTLALRKLASSADNATATAATLAMAAAVANSRVANDVERTALRNLAGTGVPSVRAAALRGLADDPSAAATTVLAVGLTSPVDQVAAAAAWSMGQRPKAATAALVSTLLRSARTSGWATTIAATTALARIGATQPALLAPAADAIQSLCFHRSRIVRSNVARLLLQLPAAPAKHESLVRLMLQDESTFVRTSVASAVRSATAGLPDAVIKAATASDRDVTAAATVPNTVPSSTWRMFDIVVGNGSNQPARAEPYFFILPDGLVEAAYSDDTGTITFEHLSGGEIEFAPRNAEDDL